jgi:hypothetical protein
MDVKVYDRILKYERKVTEKAFSILPKRYQFITYLDSQGNPVESKAQAQRIVKKKDVQTVEARPQFVRPTPEEIAAKKDELAQMNQEAIEKAKEQTEVEVKERKKPGPKPKNHAQA